MVLDFFCPRWGFENTDWEEFLRQVKAAGFKGIEWFPYGESSDIEEVCLLLERYNLQFSIVMTVVGETPDFESYLLKLEQQLLALSQIGKNSVRPLFISAQVGREYFSEEQIHRCLSCCLGIGRDTGVPVYQETHRNKWSFAVHVMPQVLEKYPELLLTLDVSHWFCVSESYLEDQQAALDRAIERARHVHARIGHSQGSQVPDPALPQYAQALEAHLKIWDKWISQRKASGAARCTMTTEFGPPPYLIQTNNKISARQQQWDLNLWMKDLLHRRYNL
jgi:hypothetical protein